ncbi:hypothetical protein V8G54_023559 [Vigna mungo]|uniref:Uncharacterized protein n=1 Tax=Vigna mungo TaxID=3915 RepID=A0AAQ3N3W0_VIGMU
MVKGKNEEMSTSELSAILRVYGHNFEAFLAIVNLRKEVPEQGAQENAISKDFNSLCKDARAKSYIHEELSKIAKEKARCDKFVKTIVRKEEIEINTVLGFVRGTEITILSSCGLGCVRSVETVHIGQLELEFCGDSNPIGSLSNRKHFRWFEGNWEVDFEHLGCGMLLRISQSKLPFCNPNGVLSHCKGFFSSSLLSKSIIRPAALASRSFNTNAMRNYDDWNDDVERRSEFSSPCTVRRDDIFSNVLSQVLNMMDQFMDNPFLFVPHNIGAGARVHCGWNVRETEDALLLRMDMPRLGKEEEICDMLFCGIFDGHRPWGHFVAKKRETLSQTSLDPDVDVDITVGKKQHQFNIWKHSYLKTCAAIDRELKQNRKIDSFYSGTTASTTSDDGSLVAVQLTVDFKPGLPLPNWVFITNVISAAFYFIPSVRPPWFRQRLAEFSLGEEKLQLYKILLLFLCDRVCSAVVEGYTGSSKIKAANYWAHLQNSEFNSTA